MRKKQIYRIVFKEPPFNDDDRSEFYYSTLSAIYEEFTPEQIGCKVTRLWNIGVSDGTPYEGKKCRITRELLMSKQQDNGHVEK